MRSNRFNMLCAVLGFVLAQTASIANAKVSWTFNQGNCLNSEKRCMPGKNTYTKTYKESAGAGVDDVTVSGWANTADKDSKANVALELGKVAHWADGLGVKNADKRNGDEIGESNSPEHAIDSVYRIDMVLFDFGRLVNLHEITLGWSTTPGLDTDISVLAYTGALTTGNEAADYVRDQKASYTEETLTENGWTVVGNYEVNQTRTINPTGIESNYWIVSAYNRVFGETCETATGTGTKTCDYTPDYFKISALANTTGSESSVQLLVPEPSTALLLATALAFTRRVRFKRG